MAYFAYQLKDEKDFSVEVKIDLPPEIALTELMKFKTVIYARALSDGLDSLIIEQVANTSSVCKECQGYGFIDYPNISGHDYSEPCKACAGTGVLHE